jgi:hypothetical protein
VLVLNRLASRRIVLVAATLGIAGATVLAVPGTALAGPTYRFVATAHVSSSPPASGHDALDQIRSAARRPATA